MRVTNKIIQNNSITNINNNKVMEDKLNTQLATGKKINRPSDDPVVAIRSLRLRTSLTEIEQYYKKNAPDADNWLKITENSVDTTISLIKSMYSDCTSGSEGFKTADDRNAILGDLKGLRDEIFSAGNSEYAGRYVFTGYRTGVPLTFSNGTSKQYTITEQLDKSCLSDLTYIDTDKLSDVTSTNASAIGIQEADITSNTVHRIRISYSDCDNTVPTLEYYDTNGQKVTLTAQVISANDKTQDPYLSQTPATGKGVTFIPETGELILSDDVFSAMQSAKDDSTTAVNEGEIRITYSKTNFTKSDLRPEHYFYCETPADNAAGKMIYNEGLLDGKTDDLTKQSITYDVGFGQEIQVNTNASEVYTHDIKRDVEEMISCVEDVIKMEDTISTLEKKLASTTDETEKANIQSVLDAANKARSFLEDKMQKTFEAGIAVTQGYLDRANTAMTTIGNRSSRVELVENRLSAQQSSFKELTSDNDDADETETIIQLKSVEMTYEAALMATGKITQTSLLNYI